MNLSRPHHSREHEPETPVDLPNVVVTVATDGTLTAAVDGIAHPQPAAGAWTRATFGPLMDEITKDRTISVRVEVRECDGGVFTDIIHARKPTPPARAAQPEPAPGTRRGRRATPRTQRLMEVGGEGFVPGEDVAVAVIVSHTDAAHTGTVRALVDLDDLPTGATGEAILFGRISGTTAIRRLQ
ncbi:hypothetical protein G7070_00005 [Propioniciclava coleopterorum]|uniref:Uncharacterized protein n=1 Tax=Propioniciclava coleopterorum TaxID=2714937 RepID=A0A6G7YAL6_9ACTN|nr:hypothetical protein [Propioniciclava coleopterorum]QIK73726.1 hypothetical protein G7070_00005 [Propioniciclava coleopterorum]